MAFTPGTHGWLRFFLVYELITELTIGSWLLTEDTRL